MVEKWSRGTGICKGVAVKVGHERGVQGSYRVSK